MNTKQEDYINELDQYLPKYNGEVYIKLLRGFDIKREREYVARLNSALDGMVQCPKRWFYMLYMGLQACVMSLICIANYLLFSK